MLCYYAEPPTRYTWALMGKEAVCSPDEIKPDTCGFAQPGEFVVAGLRVGTEKMFAAYACVLTDLQVCSLGIPQRDVQRASAVASGSFWQ